MKGGRKMKLKMIGGWAFLIGVVLAIVTGVLGGLGTVDLTTPMMTSVLVVLGLLVGLFNVTSKEVTPFLMSGIVLILASIFGAGLMASVPVISATLMALMMIFVPAVIIVAIKNVFNMAKN
jgi:hypothetical protein